MGEKIENLYLLLLLSHPGWYQKSLRKQGLEQQNPCQLYLLYWEIHKNKHGIIISSNYN